MSKKKLTYAESSINQKIEKTLSTSCIIVASVLSVIAVAFIIIIASYAEDHFAKGDEQSSAWALAAALLVLIIVVGVWLTFFVIRQSSKKLHKSIYKPMTELIFGVKKANEGFENIGIVLPDDTEDEITLLNSVYFKMAKQLKIHVDDVMKLSGLTEKFENSAHYDELTGVYNRRRFSELIKSHAVIAAKKNEPTFVFMLDLDFFKKVNDTYGHAAGDEVLKVVANRITNTVRPYDLFGRYGGEEFVMFISAGDADVPMNFAERIRTVVSESPVHFEGVDIPITVSIGVAQMAPERAYETAVKCADEALYKAKANGRNRVELYDAVEISDGNRD